MQMLTEKSVLLIMLLKYQKSCLTTTFDEVNQSAVNAGEQQLWLAEEELMHWVEMHHREVEKVAWEGAAGGTHISGTPCIEEQQQGCFGKQSSAQQFLQDDIVLSDSALTVSISQPESVGASAELRGHLNVVTFASAGSIAGVEEKYYCSLIERNKAPLQITKEILDHHGQTQVCLSCCLNGTWSVNSSDNTNIFTVNFDDPIFWDVLKHPWDHPEWSTPSRINILLELVYWETKLSTTPDVFKYELFQCTHHIVRRYEMLPPLLYLRDLVKEGNDQVWGGGYTDIYQG
ncbi:hypothetical protein BT96DRAFT_947959 [Gymnopus androsaceus JB14]|uniref:Uncharacterized protein n=1 Tax=Gymnopus androsaceus JB14 TaxID=1447944 RepID=A0A6A4GQ99_9AGAR|nr:hypothetical protein BT96DRAFT_947959 [Gymnopus androsaceus JB14]